MGIFFITRSTCTVGAVFANRAGQQTCEQARNRLSSPSCQHILLDLDCGFEVIGLTVFTCILQSEGTCTKKMWFALWLALLYINNNGPDRSRIRVQFGRLLKSAEEYDSRGDHTNALLIYDKVVDRAENFLKQQPSGIEKSRAALNALQVAHYNRAAILETQGMVKEAMRDYNATLRVIIRRYQALGRTKGFNRARELDRAAQVHLKMGDIASKKFLWEVAVRHYSAATRLRPQDPSAHFNLGSSHLNTHLQYAANAAPSADMMETAVQAFREAVRLAPSNSRYRVSLGVSLAHAGRMAEAQTVLGSFLDVQILEHPTASVDALSGALSLHMYVAFAVESVQPTWALQHLERALDMWRLLGRHAYKGQGAASREKTKDEIASLPRHLQRSIPTLFYRLGRVYEEHDRAASGAADSGEEWRLQEETTPGAPRTRHERLYAEAVASPWGVWTDAMQRPGYFFARDRALTPLLARPWWRCKRRRSEEKAREACLSEEEQARLLSAEIMRAIRLLEANFAAIKAEFVSAVEMQGASQVEGVGDRVSLGADDERVADAGRWNRVELVRDGTRVYDRGGDGEQECGVSAHSQRQCTKTQRASTLARAFPTTIEVLEKVLDAAADRLPRGSAVFSVLQPGTHLRKHCGPTNHRLRLHLPLIVPPATATGVAPGLRVGAHVQHWSEGEVTVFDDSFEHEAWNPTPLPRVVLLLDVWHPGLKRGERGVVRRDFEDLREGVGADPDLGVTAH